MTTLAIDTSNELLGVALVRNGTLIGEIMTNMKGGQTARLMPAIVTLMEQVNVTTDELEKIVVAHGPGSYTGVRVGVTTAKTMAWGLDIPIFPVSSLRALAFNAQFHKGYVMPFFNARRNAVFTALYHVEAGKITEVIEEQYVSLTDWIAKLAEKLVGNNEDKIVCLSPHIDVFGEEWWEQLRDRIIIPSQEAHQLRPVHLICASEGLEEVPAHLIQPNYLRITEAEANLLKQQRSE